MNSSLLGWSTQLGGTVLPVSAGHLRPSYFSSTMEIEVTFDDDEREGDTVIIGIFVCDAASADQDRSDPITNSLDVSHQFESLSHCRYVERDVLKHIAHREDYLMAAAALTVDNQWDRIKAQYQQWHPPITPRTPSGAQGRPRDNSDWSDSSQLSEQQLGILDRRKRQRTFDANEHVHKRGAGKAAFDAYEASLRSSNHFMLP